MILCRRIDSPIGPLMLAADDAGLRHIEFRDNRHPANRADWHGGDSEILQASEAQLADYFAGTRRDFDLPLAPQGTAFQLQVWHELARIPFGATISYAQLAQRIGKPEAVRAVGAANGRNPSGDRRGRRAGRLRRRPADQAIPAAAGRRAAGTAARLVLKAGAASVGPTPVGPTSVEAASVRPIPVEAVCVEAASVGGASAPRP